MVCIGGDFRIKAPLGFLGLFDRGKRFWKVSGFQQPCKGRQGSLKRHTWTLKN